MYFDSPPSSFKSHSQNLVGLKKASMLVLSREATKMNFSLKIQMMISSNKNEFKNTVRKFGAIMNFFLTKVMILGFLKKTSQKRH